MQGFLQFLRRRLYWLCRIFERIARVFHLLDENTHGHADFFDTRACRFHACIMRIQGILQERNGLLHRLLRLFGMGLYIFLRLFADLIHLLDDQRRILRKLY